MVNIHVRIDKHIAQLSYFRPFLKYSMSFHVFGGFFPKQMPISQNIEWYVHSVSLSEPASRESRILGVSKCGLYIPLNDLYMYLQFTLQYFIRYLIKRSNVHLFNRCLVHTTNHFDQKHVLRTINFFFPGASNQRKRKPWVSLSYSFK